MIKSELIQLIAQQNPHLYHRDVERIINTIFDEIIVALSRGDRVELRGLRGVFRQEPQRSPRAQSADWRFGRRGRQADSFFKTGKELRDRLNEEGG